MAGIALIVFVAWFACANSAPALYDQRQDGKLNVHADLENFLIVIATNSKINDFGFMGSLALQQLMEARQKAQQSPQSSEKFEYKLEESSADEGKEPYSVEILKLRKEDEGRPVIIQENPKPVVPQELQDHSRKQKVDDSKTVELKVINLSRRRSEQEPVKEEVPNVQNPVVVPHPILKDIEEKKKIRSGQEEKTVQPVKLLGDGVENCGPGRFRNMFGICEAEEGDW